MGHTAGKSAKLVQNRVKSARVSVSSDALLEMRLAEDMETTQVPINRQLDEKAVAHICKGTLAIKRTKSYHLQQHGWT